MLKHLLLLLAAAMPSGCRGVTISGDWVSVTTGSKICNALDYGAVGDGKTDDTKALQAAIDACSGAAGGNVVVPAGKVFLSFALTVPSATSNFGLNIAGTLLFSNDTKKWGTSASGACITIQSASFVALYGTGTVDGNGAVWWAMGKSATRPHLVDARGVTDLLISGLHFLNGPNHMLELYAGPMEVVDTSIVSSPSCGRPTDPADCAHNTDGIDVHGSPSWVHRCVISTGDDHLAFHANDALASDNTFGTGHGASIGSLGAGTNLRNITVRDSTFDGAVTAIRIKADSDSSGTLQDVTYANLAVNDVSSGTIVVTAYYDKPAPGAPNSTLAMSGLVFSNVSATASVEAGQFMCSPAAPCAVALANVVHHGATKPWQCQFVRGTATDVVPPLACLP